MQDEVASLTSHRASLAQRCCTRQSGHRSPPSSVPASRQACNSDKTGERLRVPILFARRKRTESLEILAAGQGHRRLPSSSFMPERRTRSRRSSSMRARIAANSSAVRPRIILVPRQPTCSAYRHATCRPVAAGCETRSMGFRGKPRRFTGPLICKILIIEDQG